MRIETIPGLKDLSVLMVETDPVKYNSSEMAMIALVEL